MAYKKQVWNNYNDGLTEIENDNNNALATPQRMNHIETGIEQVEFSLSQQLEQTDTDLHTRAINLLFPPAPLVACVGDGVTDDSSRINAIINSLEDGGTIEVPRGFVFLVGSSIVPKSNISITGRGTLLGAEDLNDNLINVSNVENVMIEKVTLKHQKENTNVYGSKTGIRLDNAKNVNIEYCNILDCDGDGIYNKNVSNSMIKGNFIRNINRNGIAISNQIDHLTIEDNTLTDLHFHGINAENSNQTDQVSFLTIKNNTMKGSSGNNSGHGVLITTTYESLFIKYKNCKIVDNTIQDLLQAGTVRAAEEVIVKNNVAISVKRGWYVGRIGQDVKNVTVSENTISIDEGNGDGLVISDGTRLKVIGNTITGANGTGINVSNVMFPEVKDNHVIETGKHGIQSTGKNDELKIVGNTIVNAEEVGIRVSAPSGSYPLNGLIQTNTVLDNRDVKLMKNGIRFYSDPNNMYVLHNDVSRVATTPIILGSGENIVDYQNNYTV